MAWMSLLLGGGTYLVIFPDGSITPYTFPPAEGESPVLMTNEPPSEWTVSSTLQPSGSIKEYGRCSVAGTTSTS
jgi:hypothetical protein